MTRTLAPAQPVARRPEAHVAVPSARRLAELRDRHVRAAAGGLRLVDDWGRDHDNLRISVTARCNFACSFCHNEGQGFAPWEQAADRPEGPGKTAGDGRAGEMTPAEIERAARLAAGFGLSRMKLTGGEPTLRADLPDIVRRLRPFASDLSMTTNGLLLPRLARPLAEAGLDRVNVSLHSLDRGVFARVTGRDLLPQVLAGIDAAVEAGLSPVKVNAVVMRDHNRDELPALAAFARDKGLVLQLIELDSPDDDHFGAFAREQHASLRPVEDRLLRAASAVERRRMHGRVAVLLRGTEPFGPVAAASPTAAAVPAPGTRAPASAAATSGWTGRGARLLPMVSGNGLLLDAQAGGDPMAGPGGAAPAGSGADVPPFPPHPPVAGAYGADATASERDGGLRVELVRPQGNRAFCAACTRIRITADGAWKSCLNRDDNHVPFLAALRAGASDEDLEGLLLECIARREPYWR